MNINPPKNKDELWAVICHLRDFTLPDVMSAEGVPLRTIRRQVASLVRSGHLSEKRDGAYKRYHVVVSALTRPNVRLDGTKKQPTGRQRMWMGMKAKKVFDFWDVALFAGVSTEAARQYCYALRAAGYLTVRKPATVNDQPEIYVFSRDTGFHAPQITRDKKVFDRNMGRIVWPESEVA